MTIYQQKKKILLPVIGTLAVSLIAIVYILLGKGSYVQVHDQMDGEILNYIYQAKYLFQGDVIPEFMNGMGKEAMTPPAPFGVLFYKIFEPFMAFVVMQWFVVAVGFFGMYYLCSYLQLPEEVGFVTGAMFAYMPFYPTYGLACLGAPLLVLSFLRYVKGEKQVWALGGIVLYAGMSSLTLVGFVWLLAGGVLAICFFVKEKQERTGWNKTMRTVMATGVLLITYLLVNLNLLKTLFGTGYVTHREEMAIATPVDFMARFEELFFQGGSYSNTYAAGICLVGLLVIFMSRYCRQGEMPAKARRIGCLLGGVFVAALAAATWNTAFVLGVRSQIGGMLKHFQADRIYWIFPFVWMLLFALILDYIVAYIRLCGRRFRGMLALSIGLLLFALQGAQIFRDSTMNKNLRLLLVDGYSQKQTWESIYMEDVFAKIDEVLPGEKSEYSVVSLGIYPSAALYNGFVCADGYSNNYDLEYKHAFRRIIANELEKREEVRTYFDDWGNRLYLPSAEFGYDVTLQKGKGYIYEDLSYDMAAMKDMNVRYLFAAAPISNEEALGLELLDGSPFSSETSYYEVFVYEVK